MFWCFGSKACGILAPQPGVEPAPPALEGKVLTTGPPGKSLSYLIFKSLRHFEFIFVCGMRVCSNFIDLHEVVQLSQHHLLKRWFFFFVLYSCLLCQRLIEHRYVGLLLDFLLCSINPYVCFSANTMLF